MDSISYNKLQYEKNADQMKYFRFNKIVMMMRGINIDDWVFACMQIPKYKYI